MASTSEPASHSSQQVRLNETDLCLHVWGESAPNASDNASVAAAAAAGIVVIFHGFLAHGLYPTVRFAAEALSRQNYIVVAADARGHGQSAGLRGYLPSRETVAQDGVAVVQKVQELFNKNEIKMKTFLVGSSMGGTIALSVALDLQNENKTKGGVNIAGVALLAPMLRLSVSPPARTLLWALSFVAPTWSIIPSSNSSNAEKQYRDPVKRQECIDDVYAKANPENSDSSTTGRCSTSSDTNNKTIRIASASTCVELAGQISDDFSRMTLPLLILLADEDVVVNNDGAVDLYTRAPSVDKSLRRYPALHGLLCEPSPLVDTIQADLLEWIQARS